MFVITKPALTALARACRRELSAIGAEVGHQTSLNLCLSALGFESPNRPLAALDRRPLLLASTPKASLEWGPGVAVAQFCRLASAEIDRLGSGARGTFEGVCSAGLRACRASVGPSPAALVVPPEARFRPEGAFGALVLEVADALHESPDIRDLSRRPMAERASRALARSRRVEAPDAGAAFERALAASLFALDSSAAPIAFQVVSLAAWISGTRPEEWSGSEWTPPMLDALEGRGAFAGLGKIVFRGSAGSRPVRVRWPDGRVDSLDPALLEDDAGGARLHRNAPPPPWEAPVRTRGSGRGRT